MGSNELVTRQVVLRVAHGLHLSPISQLVRCASSFQAAVTLSFDGRTADAKSVYDLMQLAAPCGSNLKLEANGVDAEAAAESVAQLFNGGFISLAD
jgi:phosphocarrier protein HPr